MPKKKTQKWLVFKEGEIDEDTKKMAALDGWRKKVFDDLRSFEGEQTDFWKKNLPPDMNASKRSENILNQFLEIIPKKMMTKGKILLSYLLPKINLDDNNCIIYTNKIGSPLIDLILFILSPVYLKRKMPPDIGDFAQLLIDLKIPKSAMARDDLESLSRLKDRNIFDAIKSENNIVHDVVWQTYESLSPIPD